jgi:hypothetical protein
MMPPDKLIAALYQIVVILLVLRHNDFGDLIHHFSICFKESTRQRLLQHGGAKRILITVFVVSLEYNVFHTHLLLKL